MVNTELLHRVQFDEWRNQADVISPGEEPELEEEDGGDYLEYTPYNAHTELAFLVYLYTTVCTTSCCTIMDIKVTPLKIIYDTTCSNHHTIFNNVNKIMLIQKKKVLVC